MRPNQTLSNCVRSGGIKLTTTSSAGRWAASHAHGSQFLPKNPKIERIGGDSGTRTRNLGIANAALSQLSYTPTRWPSAARSTDHMFIVANRSVGCQGDATAGWLGIFPVTGLARRAPGDCCCRRCKWNHRRRCRIRGGGRGRRRLRHRRRHGRQAVRRRWW